MCPENYQPEGKVVLGESDYWFLESFKFEGDQITIKINEGIVSSKIQDIKINDTKKVEGCFPIEVNEKSRKVNIKFFKVLAHQVVDESYAIPEDGKIDGKVLYLHHGSTYLKYVTDNSLVSQLIDDPILHYSVNLGDDIIHVITTQQPEVNPIS
ncbi:MAG: hypothetical protein ACJ0K4_06795 [Verrucomicrobiales bacterium]